MQQTKMAYYKLSSPFPDNKEDSRNTHSNQYCNHRQQFPTIPPLEQRKEQPVLIHTVYWLGQYIQPMLRVSTACPPWGCTCDHTLHQVIIILKNIFIFENYIPRSTVVIYL